MLPSEIPKLPTDPPVRGFRGVWKLLLFQDPSESAYLRQIRDAVSGTPVSGMLFHLLHRKEKGPG